jgi:hypothetical protein
MFEVSFAPGIRVQSGGQADVQGSEAPLSTHSSVYRRTANKGQGTLGSAPY